MSPPYILFVQSKFLDLDDADKISKPDRELCKECRIGKI